jgi:hypothetical protein
MALAVVLVSCGGSAEVSTTAKCNVCHKDVAASRMCEKCHACSRCDTCTAKCTGCSKEIRVAEMCGHCHKMCLACDKCGQ